MIPVTKPFLPCKEDYEKLLEGIWNRNWLTNNGPLVNELESSLKEYLKLKHLLYVSNGTIALQIAFKALELTGEVITTPFSYVATTSSLVWEGLIPVFVDIDAKSFNIDPDLIEAAITSKTTAILATHVYGNPCDIDKIEAIARKYKLKVVFDAAHCFGTKYKGNSVLEYGDISTISFHATKLYHTIEGGAVITRNRELLKKMSYLRNFGHDGVDKFRGVGINAKNSEFHAAMGIVNLKEIDEILVKRKEDHLIYDRWFINVDIIKPIVCDNSIYNYSYYPIVLENEDICLKVIETLGNEKIFARRYFYPLLSNLDYVNNQDLPIAESIAKRVLCLPLYYDLSKEEIDMICRLILRVINN